MAERQQAEEQRTGATPKVVRELCQRLEERGFRPTCDTERGTIAIAASEFGFATDSARIPPSVFRRVVQLGLDLMYVLEHHERNIRYVLLTAQADCRGTASHNMALSQDRAQSIWEAWREDPRLAGYFDPNDDRNSVALLSIGGKLIVGGVGESRATRSTAEVGQELARCDAAAAEAADDRRIEFEVIPAAD